MRFPEKQCEEESDMRFPKKTGFVSVVLTAVIFAAVLAVSPLQAHAAEEITSYTYDQSLNACFEAMTAELYSTGIYTVPATDPAIKEALEQKFRFYFLGYLYMPSVHLDLPGFVQHIMQAPPERIQQEVTNHMAALQTINKFARQCEGLSDLDKVTFFHDYLSAYLTYDYDGYTREKAGGTTAVRDVFHTLTGRIAVCDGYSRTFYALCGASGVPVRYVTTGKHAWNEVCLDGVWKKIDVTWDSAGWGYTYFLVPVDYTVTHSY